MFYGNVCRIIICRILPNNLSNKIFLTKHLIAQPFQISLLIIVNRDKDNSIVSKQIACK